MDTKINQMFFGKVTNGKMYHSRGYHNYFHGYIERKSMDYTGNTKIERIYTGTYYLQGETDRQWRWKKAKYTLFCLTAAFFYMTAGTRDIISNRIWYGFLPQIAVNLGLIWIFALLICLLGAPRKIKIRTYLKVSCALKKASLFNGITLLTASFMAVICPIAQPGIGWSTQLPAILLFLAGSALMFRLYKMELDAVYQEVSNPVKARPEDYKIEC